MFDADGDPVGAEFVVNTMTDGTQSAADVAALPGGGFIVTWQGPLPGGADFEVYAQVFDSAGGRVGSAFVVNSETNANQLRGRVEVLPSGDLVLLWTDSSGVGGDSSSSGIKMQILTLSSDAPTDIALSTMSVSEVAIENLPVALLGATGGGLNSSFTYEIVSDESGGAFAIEGDRLIIADNFRLDFETQPNVEVRIRATDINGASYEETFTIAVGDVAVETRYSAGDEFTVNTDTEGFNVPLAIAPLASGGFVVVSSWFEFGVGDGFRMQIFDSAGAPVGAEIDLDLMERGGSRMVVVGLGSGGFVIAYEGNSIDLGGGSNGFPIRAQRFDSAGNEVGPDLLVSMTNNGILGDPQIATLDSGGFVVAWSQPHNEDGSPGFGGQITARVYRFRWNAARR